MFKLYAVDEIGYPDYIEYDYRDSKNCFVMVDDEIYLEL